MIFLKDRNTVTLGLEDYFKGKLTDNLYEAKVLVTWSDIPVTERKQIEMAKSLGIKTFVVQHGRNASVDYDPEYVDMNGSNKGEPCKFIADYFFAWSEKDKQRMIRGGVKPEQVVVVGCPLIPCQIPELDERKFIVFLSHHDLRPDLAKVNEEIHNILAREFQKDYILIYSSTYLNEPLLAPIDKVTYGRTKIDGAERSAWINMMSILRKTKCVVSCMASSFEGLAMCFKDIPIVRAMVDLGVRDKDGNINFEANGVKLAGTSELIKSIKEIKDETNKKERIKIAQDEYGLDLLPALPRMVKEISKWL